MESLYNVYPAPLPLARQSAGAGIVVLTPLVMAHPALQSVAKYIGIKGKYLL